MLSLNTGDTGFVMLCTALVCMMTPALALFYGGMVRKKNVLTIMMQNFISMGVTAIIAGLFQFSAVLTAIGLGTTFYNPNWRVVCYTFLGTVFTVVAQGALNVLLNVYGIPTLTFPFVVAAWIFLLPNIDLLPKNYQS